MTDRILDFSLSAAALSIRNGLLVVTENGIETAAVPCSEIAAVIISHPQVTFTQAVLAALANAGAAVVVGDATHRPAGLMLPVESHHIQAERFVRQSAMPRPKRKRLWQQIVRAKIRAQATVLEEATGLQGGLRALTCRVRSGDPDNVEARAARRYWSLLFGDSGFIRANAEDSRNAFLNYGYAVLRAATARAICASGLHPTFGLQHRNKANAFALADDLMEPFRPAVDRVVIGLDGSELNAEHKRALISAICARYQIDGENRVLTDVLQRVAQSLALVVLGERDDLWLPEWAPAHTDVIGGTRRKPVDQVNTRARQVQTA